MYFVYLEQQEQKQDQEQDQEQDVVHVFVLNSTELINSYELSTFTSNWNVNTFMWVPVSNPS